MRGRGGSTMILLYNYMFGSKTTYRKYAGMRCVRSLFITLHGYRNNVSINEAPLRTACS